MGKLLRIALYGISSNLHQNIIKYCIVRGLLHDISGISDIKFTRIKMLCRINSAILGQVQNVRESIQLSCAQLTELITPIYFKRNIEK